jgi:hypothetical protein
MEFAYRYHPQWPCNYYPFSVRLILEFTSSTPGNLKTHMLSHSDLKPIKCDLCEFETNLR